MTQRLYRMLWLQKEGYKSDNVFGWARQNFENLRQQYPHLYPNELTIYTDSPYDPMIEVLTLTKYLQLSREHSISISNTITQWLKANKYITSDSEIDVWEMVYPKY